MRETFSNFQNSYQNFLQKIQFFQVLINREFLSINRMLFSIDRLEIEQQSNHLKTPTLFFSSFRSIEQKLRPIENPYFRISLRKFQNLNFHFMKQYSLNSNIIITTYPCIYLYIYIYNIFFVKLDVFSFGVIQLEIISRKSNIGFYLAKHAPTLLAYVHFFILLN